MSSASPSATIVTPPAPQKRILSLDQFRGYTVVGMLLVNYLGFDCVPRILTHTHDYNSYADTIMPHFLFAVGFAFRLTFGRRVQEQGVGSAYGRVVRRLLGLVLVAIVVYAPGRLADSWQGLQDMGLDVIAAKVLKRSWFQTLLHIAATSLWLVPVIRAGFGVRFAWMVMSAVIHIAIAHWNYTWNNTDPNGIDGGPMGFLTWTVPAMLGTFACDAVAAALASGKRPPLLRMTLWSFGIMAMAWVMSCGTRMYDVPESQRPELMLQKLADRPAFPPADVVKAHFQKPLSELLAEPPFVHPPWGPADPLPDPDVVAPPVDEAAIQASAASPEEAQQAIAEANRERGAKLKRIEELKKEDPSNGPYFRKWNYWMMSQRGGNLSYPLFAGGFSLFVYVLFYIACDMWGWRLAFFQTFGTNALLAYVLHGMVGRAVKAFVPGDAPALYVWGSVVLYFAINWVILRHFEKQKVFLRV